MRELRGKGYIGNSMSVNAKNAHLNDEMPLSHWTKKKMLEVIEEMEINVNLNLLKRLTKDQLQENFLDNTSWHHTGALFNVTDFYSLDILGLENISNEDIQEKINARKAWLKETREERAKENELKVDKRLENKKRKEFESELEELHPFSTYKTVNGFIKAVDQGRITKEALDNLKIMKQASDNEKEATQFKSVAGQIRKQFSFKSANEMYDLYLNNELPQEVIDTMNEKTYLKF